MLFCVDIYMLSSIEIYLLFGVLLLLLLLRNWGKE